MMTIALNNKREYQNIFINYEEYLPTINTTNKHDVVMIIIIKNIIINNIYNNNNN